MAETIKGMDKLIRKLNTVAKLKGAKRGLKAGAKRIKGKIAQYPLPTEANSPGRPGGWYQRGFGPRWARKDGSWGGRKTSERLDTKWAMEERAGGLQQVIGNNASYAPYVHDADEQAKIHGDRGWLTDEQVLKSEGEQVLEFIQNEIEKELGG